jgi:hypothetical protein
MSRVSRESWTFRVEVPADVSNPGRFVARLLKHLKRVWRVKCSALVEAPPDTDAGEASSSTVEGV